MRTSRLLGRLMLVGLRARRLGRIAKREGASPSEVEDAVQLLALGSHFTEDEVLALVEDHGLEGAQAQIDATRGEA